MRASSYRDKLAWNVVMTITDQEIMNSEHLGLKQLYYSILNRIGIAASRYLIRRHREELDTWLLSDDFKDRIAKEIANQYMDRVKIT